MDISPSLAPSFEQLRAIIRYEILMQWRRRLLPMLYAVMLAALTLIIVSTFAGADTTDSDLNETTTILVFVLFGGLGWALPFMVADTVAKDRQHHIWPILNSTPLPPGVYLAGKVLSVWSLLCAGLFSLLLLGAIEVWVLHGGFDVLTFFASGVTSASAIIFYSSLGVLIGATQPTRRRAAFVALAITVWNLLLMVTLSGTTRDAILGNSGVFFMHYAAINMADASPYSTFDRVLTLASMIAQLTLVWAIIWWWLRTQYNRA